MAEGQAATGSTQYKSYETGNVLLILSYFFLFLIWGLSYFILMPVSFNLISTSCLIIFIGSHRSLKLENAVSTDDDSGNQEDVAKPGKIQKETISADDAYKFPLVGSAALFSLYIAFKYFDKDVVNLLLSLYFSVIGIFTLTSTFSPFMMEFVKNPYKHGTIFTLPYLGEIDATANKAEIISFILSTIFAVFYFKTKHFILNNVLGISFCVQAIAKISLGSYKVGAILLIGLFFYDIFWVFGTDVMVTVAKSFDGPIKLLFPRSFATAEAKAEFSLLGLGDIVIPGLFVALLLRFDVKKACVDPNLAEYLRFPKPYFLVNMVSYGLGLLTTVLIMYYFKAAQPALLYLVPACLLGSILVAVVRGQLWELFAYSEEEPPAKEGGSKKSD